MGKFKYIDKYKSKAGNWVYKYSRPGLQAFNSVGLGNANSGAGVHLGVRKKKTNGLIAPGSNRDRRVKKKNGNSIGRKLSQLNDKYGPKNVVSTTSHHLFSKDQKRVTETTKTNVFGGKVTSHTRTTVRKTDFDKEADESDKRWMAQMNERYHPRNNSKVAQWLGKMNDKYGPKTVSTYKSSAYTKNGEKLVHEYTQNLIGGRYISANNYREKIEDLTPKRKRSVKHKRSNDSSYVWNNTPVPSERRKYVKKVKKKREIKHSDESLYLMHHGVKGQKWGVRRYQNPNGTLTDEGKKRYGVGTHKFFTQNVRETAGRSAKASVKASNKNAAITSAIMGVASGTLGAMSYGAIAGGPAGAAVGLGYGAVTSALTYAGETSAAALWGGAAGALAGRKQDKAIRQKTKLGEKVVLEQLTVTDKRTNYGYFTMNKFTTTAKKME